MQVVSSHTIQRVRCLLYEGTDYQSDDLEFDRLIGAGHFVNANKLREIAQRNGFDRCEWSGKTYDSAPHIEAVFAKVVD